MGLNHLRDLTLLALFLVCSACHEAVEGCLDIESTNYDVSADRDCADDQTSGDCPCKYPSLTLILDRLHQKTELDLDSVYVTETGDSYKILDYRFLLSEMTLVNVDGTELTATDSIEIFIQEGDNRLSNHMNHSWVIISKSGSSVRLEDLRTSGSFVSIRGLLGIDPQYANLDIDNDDSNLENLSNLFYKDGGFVNSVFSLAVGTSLQDTVELVSTQSAAWSDALTIENIPGSNLSATISIDFSHIIGPIDFENDSYDTQVSKLQSGLISSIRFD